MLYGGLSVAVLPFLFPSWWMITASLLPIQRVFAQPPTLIPLQPEWGNYRRVFELQPFAQQYLNSLYIAGIVTLGTLIVATAAGYGFARVRFPAANVLFLVVITGLMVPSEVTIVPIFQLARSLGMIDTHWPLVIIPIFGPPAALCMFVMRQFFLGIPRELEDAGRIDGLSRAGVLIRVAVPLARAPLAAIAIISFLRSWDMYLEPLTLLSTREKFTLPLALTTFADGYGEPIWNVQMAATTLSVLPVLAVFVLAQRYFIEGLALTGVKG